MTLELGQKIRIGILGASGYTGAELVRLLARHPNADIVVMTADSHAGEPYEQVYPHLGGLDLPALVKVDEVEWAGIEIDLVFCGLPHGTTQEIIDDIKHCQEIGITQLTYDFRTPDVHDCIRTMQHVAEKVVPVI